MRIVIVSNRLPLVIEPAGEGWTTRPGSGGLITALAPVLRRREGLWVGWPGVAGSAGLEGFLDAASRELGFGLHPVLLDQDDLDEFYHGFANEIVWPLFHDLQTRCNFNPAYWRRFLHVNARFAHAVAARSRPDDYVWVHDYHLMDLARALVELGVKRRTGFFLHIPFPPLDIFVKLPWRDRLLRALLLYDLIGFQTPRDRRNFLQCLAHLCPDVAVSGRGPVVAARVGARTVRVGDFPIGIDFEHFARLAASAEVAERAWFFHEAIPERQIILGLDRLDYTKGIPQRLRAFRAALRTRPELQGKASLFQVVVPSRAGVPEYQALKAEIERLVGEVNGEFTRPEWMPIHYLYRHLEPLELIAFYRASEIALVTPLKDGMNLVAKEYCAANIDERGVLILSEFAGAAAQLRPWALIVNPYDEEGMAAKIYEAYTMAADRRQQRMRRLRDKIRRQNVFAWVDAFLGAAEEGPGWDALGPGEAAGP